MTPAIAPTPSLHAPRGLVFRLFLTCWLIYGLHFATNTPREIFLVLSLGDDFSFRVDDYAGLHADLFEKEGYGWHINNNPGVSMLAAIPYALSRPVLDPIVAGALERRRAAGLSEPPDYESPFDARRSFFRQAWVRGQDIKLGLASLVVHALFMAPLAALGAVFMFWALRSIHPSDRAALWLSLLYAIGTPVFFRNGFLNQNLALGIVAFMGFWGLWNPLGRPWPSVDARLLLGGLAGGSAVLLDYSGVVFLFGLLGYAVLRRQPADRGVSALRRGLVCLCGALAPLALLWFYQWRSFGDPWLPAQRWMSTQDMSDFGYHGVGWPQADLFLAQGFDYRFGLFATCPMLFLVFVALLSKHSWRRLGTLEMATCGTLLFGLWLFAAGNDYGWLQWNTGVRYMVPIVPFIFLPIATVLVHLPRKLSFLIAALAVAQSWALAMYREVSRGLGAFEPLLNALNGGPRLPALTTLSRIESYGRLFDSRVLSFVLLGLAGLAIAALWSLPRRRERLDEG